MPKQTLIDAVRACAARKLSLQATAAELSTPNHPLTRSAVAGIATRNSISFNAKRAPGSRNPKPKPLAARKDPLLAALQQTPRVVSTKPAATPAAPQVSACSWAGCPAYAEPGDMFCFSHGRRPLLAV